MGGQEPRRSIRYGCESVNACGAHKLPSPTLPSATITAQPVESPLHPWLPCSTLLIPILFQRAPGAGLSPSGNGKPRTGLKPPALEGAPN
ncbi:hypothetical protein EVAR_95666_1 [Eumeta japonica]|uniref:Uncharacterized protein n=1 Tax=Eumeta variegata TaxID=151549 RepID=A0A4C1VKU9_EUMVA|nr:hypothetical protein EVAR_95666_1 [Eumeta japonica]